jgi:hypothetical protein
LVCGSTTASGASLWPFNHEILKKKPALAAVQMDRRSLRTLSRRQR